jgi:hypothetical protein
VFNATFNNISAISWGSVLSVKETVIPGENYDKLRSYAMIGLYAIVRF